MNDNVRLSPAVHLITSSLTFKPASVMAEMTKNRLSTYEMLNFGSDDPQNTTEATRGTTMK